MSSMDDLVQFLRDRLNEDEQTARAASDGWYGYDPEQAIAFVPPEDTRHIAHHNPARVLREVEAKRRLVDWVQLWPMRPAPPSSVDGVLELLALSYADHPDYRENWRP